MRTKFHIPLICKARKRFAAMKFDNQERENMLSEMGENKIPTGSQRFQKFMKAIKKNLLLVLTVVAVILGVLVGFGLRKLDLSVQTKMILSFPGDLLMRALKLLMLPLITSSLISGLASMDAKSSGRMGIYAIVYYLVTTILAVTLGLVLVVVIHPGNQSYKSKSINTTKTYLMQDHSMEVSTLDSVMDIIRNMFPENIVQACIQNTQTFRVYEYELIQRINDTSIKKKVLKSFETRMENHTNFIGLIVFCIAFGLCVGSMGKNADIMQQFFFVLNEVIMMLVKIVMWYSPFGILFLVSGKVMEINDFEALMKMLGMYSICVLSGLAIHALVTLPLIYFLLTKRNPFLLYRGVLQACLTAIGTASSAAALPVTFQCLDDMNIDKRVTRFVLPIGATVNMDGTALYEAVAPVFIAQINGINFKFGQLILVSLTATVASIGAASIPSAGLVTMLLVMSAVGLPAEDIMFIISIDWLLDRIRTSVNVLGDCIGCGIVSHLCAKTLKNKALKNFRLKNNDA